MLTNKPNAGKKSMTFQGKNVLRFAVLVFCVSFFLVGTACRYDMQDQPRYKAYKESEFFSDGKAMRDFPEGTVARGQLNENKALHTGKKENADPNAQVETTTDELGNTIVSSFPNAIEKMPINVTKETLDRGEQRYKIFCMVCHGPVGKGDGMVVRRGYPQPTTYHDDRLRNAPVGHFFDVITNGWGKMNGYASQIPVEDRWAIVAYIRALQVSQNPEIKSGEADSTDKAAEDNKNETEQTGEAETQEPAADNGGAN